MSISRHTSGPPAPRRASFARRLAGKTFVPVVLLSQLRFELRLAALRWNYRLNPRTRAKRRTLAAARDIKLHYGCGDRVFPGWINIDAFDGSGIDLAMDLRMPLPFGTDSTRLVFAEHILEHMDYDTDVPQILREFHRILQPGGAVRIVVPDLTKHCEAFLRRDAEWLEAVRSDGANHAQAINDVFYQHFHRRMYDAETLTHCLREAGFSNVAVTPYGKSRFPGLAMDLDAPSRAAESLCVEASKD